jgi:hypothetical protein
MRTRLLALTALVVAASGQVACATAENADAVPDATQPQVERLLQLAADEGWGGLPIGERVARFGVALEGSPYVDGSLEGPGPEQCRITMDGFDCVTFMEVCLNLARVSGGAPDPVPGMVELRDAVTFTRYRGGTLDGYTSRLHYSAEWIADNETKDVLEDVTLALGGLVCEMRLDFMSKHPNYYAVLENNPALVDSMRTIEERINRVPRACIAKADVAAAEEQFRTGDLILITTSVEGLDYSHTGMILRDADDVPRFLHASSRNERVILDGRLSEYLETGPKSNTGISVLRPIEPAH